MEFGFETNGYEIKQKIEADSIDEMWMIADGFFPTDYTKNEERSSQAGYPIYVSTAEGNHSWISDLNTRLEIHLENGKSINIWLSKYGLLKIENEKLEKKLEALRLEYIKVLDKKTRLGERVEKLESKINAIQNVIEGMC